ncbi:aprA [Symbiodinium microadriaticum]|nr:aprA [Symbiodinium microadriaticum]
MDAIKEFIAKDHPELGVQLDYYGVAGASKRGWTTWDVGAVDPTRVMAIVPIVLDAINFVDVEHHQWRSYGGWSWALNDYYEMNIMTRLDTPEMVLLQEEEDPFFYKHRLTMPKLVVNAVLDEFQQPATGIFEIVPAIGTWLEYLLERATVPTFSWTIDEASGEIVATLDGEGSVHKASMWWAYSCGNNPDGVKRRDFRIMSLDSPCECGVDSDGYCINLKSFWTEEELSVTVDPGDGRYVAFFIDIKYEQRKENLTGLPHDKPGQLEFTTEVSIWPNTFPYEDCKAESCAGQLL